MVERKKENEKTEELFNTYKAGTYYGTFSIYDF
jgi:hypothetical protein